MRHWLDFLGHDRLAEQAEAGTAPFGRAFNLPQPERFCFLLQLLFDVVRQ